MVELVFYTSVALAAAGLVTIVAWLAGLGLDAVLRRLLP